MNKSLLRFILPFFAASAMLPFAVSCGNSTKTNDASGGSEHDFPDTLKVATLYSPESYFIYRGQEMGYDYELVTTMAADKGISIKLEIASSLSRAIEMLDSGKVDLIA